MATSVTLPTQELPFYLSASTFTATTNGVVTTGVSIVNVPITYFGPSIPLGPDDVWTFGGSTSPPPTTSISSTATPTSSTSSLTLTTSSSIATATSTSRISSIPIITSTSATVSSSLISSSTSSSSTSSSAPTIPAISSTGVNLRRALPGIIIAAIVALLAIVLILILWRYRRRRMTGTYHHPNFSDFILVDSEGQPRVAGTGAPRPTGGEEDSFLRRSLDASDVARSPPPVGAPRLVTPPPRATSLEGARAIKDLRTESPLPRLSKDNPFFHASHSSLFFNPMRGPDPAVLVATPADGKRESSSTQHSSGPSISIVPGSIISPKQLMQMDDEWQSSGRHAESSTMANLGARRGTTELGEREVYNTPLRPPPVLNPDGIPATTRPPTSQQNSQRTSIHTTLSLNRPESPGGSEPDERATLLTARRVHMSEGGPSTLMHADNAAIPSSWSSSLGLGLGGLTRISRLSWFQRMESYRAGSPDSSNQRWKSHSRSMSPNRSLRQTQMAESTSSIPVSRSELSAPRPLSHVSMGSKSSTGDTIFHDARSTISTRSVPATAVPTTLPPLPPRPFIADMPRASPESSGGDSESVSQSQSAPGRHSMISPAPHAMSPLRHENIPSGEDTPAEMDILDMPVPAQLHTFSSSSSRGGPMFPPGLEQHMADINLSSVNLWRESSSDMPSAASLGSGSSRLGPSVSALGHGNTDMLEDAPPLPREGWTHLRSTAGNSLDSGRRMTSGRPVLIDLSEPSGTPSEHGSLHSLGHLSPFSASGSAPVSGANSRAPSRGTFYGSSLGSNSSRHSHFANVSHSSRPHSYVGGGHAFGVSAPSLQHSNSVSSEGRRRPRREPGEPVSGTDSPYGSSGYGQYARARLSAIGGSSYGASNSMPQLSPFGGGFLATSTSVPNMLSASRSGSNRSSNVDADAANFSAGPGLGIAGTQGLTPPSSAFGHGRTSDRIGSGSTGAPSMMTATATTASGTATASTSEAGMSEDSRTTVGDACVEEGSGVVPYAYGGIHEGSGPGMSGRGRFPGVWMREGDF